MTAVPSTHSATTHASGELAGERPLPSLLAGRDLDRMRRYREYLEYYEGRRGAPLRPGRERALSFNYARAIVEKGASYLVTDHVPVVTSLEGSEAGRAAEAERALLEVWEANDVARLDLETEIDHAVEIARMNRVVWMPEGRSHGPGRDLPSNLGRPRRDADGNRASARRL